VPEEELDSLAAAEIGQPVPAERALDADDEVATKRGDELEKRLGASHNIAVGGDLVGGIMAVSEAMAPALSALAIHICMKEDEQARQVILNLYDMMRRLGIEPDVGGVYTLLGSGWDIFVVNQSTSAMTCFPVNPEIIKERKRLPCRNWAKR
jgi:hypothetical protein